MARGGVGDDERRCARQLLGTLCDSLPCIVGRSTQYGQRGYCRTALHHCREFGKRVRTTRCALLIRSSGMSDGRCL